MLATFCRHCLNAPRGSFANASHRPQIRLVVCEDTVQERPFAGIPPVAKAFPIAKASLFRDVAFEFADLPDDSGGRKG